MKKGFLKKIGATATVVAMLASLGTTAFAAETLTIGDVSVTDVDGDGVYTVEVDYTASGAIETGITMLAYANKSGNAFVGNTGAAASDTYNQSTMEIVGIDQLDADASKNTSGTISFNVTTNDSAGDLKMEVGEAGILMLGGGNVDTPTGVYFVIPKTVAVATNATVDPVSVTVAPGVDAAVVKAAVENAIKGKTATVTGGDEVATVALTTATFGDLAESSDEDCTHTIVVTIPANTATGNDYLKITEDIDVTVHVTVTEKNFDATGAKLNQANNTITLSEIPADLAALNTAVEGKIETIGVVITGAEEGDAAAVAFDDLTIAGPESYTANEEGQEVTYTVTVPAGTEVLGVNAFETDLTFDVTVNIPAEGGDPVYLGDVNLDGNINNTDFNLLKLHLSGKRTSAELSDVDSVNFAAANIDGNDKLNNSDFNLLKLHLSGKRVHDEIGVSQVGVKPAN